MHTRQSRTQALETIQEAHNDLLLYEMWLNSLAGQLAHLRAMRPEDDPERKAVEAVIRHMPRRLAEQFQILVTRS